MNCVGELCELCIFVYELCGGLCEMCVVRLCEPFILMWRSYVNCVMYCVNCICELCELCIFVCGEAM